MLLERKQLNMKLFHRLFGYCEMCNHWFVYPKRRRMNTRYEDDKLNYCKVCACCYEQIDVYWEERWDEYNSGRL